MPPRLNKNLWKDLPQDLKLSVLKNASRQGAFVNPSNVNQVRDLTTNLYRATHLFPSKKLIPSMFARGLRALYMLEELLRRDTPPTRSDMAALTRSVPEGCRWIVADVPKELLSLTVMDDQIDHVIIKFTAKWNARIRAMERIDIFMSVFPHKFERSFTCKHGFWTDKDGNTLVDLSKEAQIVFEQLPKNGSNNNQSNNNL